MEGMRRGSMFNDWIHTREIIKILLPRSDSHHSASFLTSQTMQSCKYFCLSRSKNITRCHSLPPSVLCHKPRESFMTDGWWLEVLWSPDLGWMGPECHNSNGIFTITMWQNWPPGIKTVHSPTPRITDFQQGCKNSFALCEFCTERWITVETFPSDEMKWILNKTQ